jgi:hypothetical protein
MRKNQAFPSTYIKAADVKAKPIIAVISHLAQEAIGQDKQEKHVLHFEHGKPLVLNRVNWEMLEDTFGDSDDWTGHKVKLYAARTTFQSKIVDCVRVQPINPQPAAKPAVEDADLNDEITI